MNRGDVVLANSKKGFIQQAIKWFTKSQFCHSFVTMPTLMGFPMCMEAAENGVDMTRFDTSYQNNQDQGYEVWSINIDQDIKDQALKTIINDLEIMYGVFQYPWFIWRKLNMLLGRDIKAQNNWTHDGMICSQLCVMYLRACGLDDILAGYGNGSISPQDLRDIFKAHPDLFVLSESVRL